VAAIVGAVLGEAVGLLVSPSLGIVAGGLLGPAAGLAVPERAPRNELPA